MQQMCESRRGRRTLFSAMHAQSLAALSAAWCGRRRLAPACCSWPLQAGQPQELPRSSTVRREVVLTQLIPGRAATHRLLKGVVSDGVGPLEHAAAVHHLRGRGLLGGMPRSQVNGRACPSDRHMPLANECLSLGITATTSRAKRLFSFEQPCTCIHATTMNFPPSSHTPKQTSTQARKRASKQA